MSDIIDLLDDEDNKPEVIYSPKILSGIMVAYTSTAVGRAYRHLLDFNRYLSSIWQTHPDGYRYINVKDIVVEQRINDADILRTTVTLDIIYRNGEFTINKAELGFIEFRPVEDHIFVSYATPNNPVIESVTVDGQHVLATGHKPPEPKILSKELPTVLHTVEVLDSKGAVWYFHPSLHASTLRDAGDGSLRVDFDNVRMVADYHDNAAGDSQRIDVGITGTVTFVNGVGYAPDIKLINPKVFVLTDDWKESQVRPDFFGYVDKLHFDKDRMLELDAPAGYDLHPYVWLEGMNHHPEHMGHWVKFNGWRMKDRYDLMLFNGETHRCYRPNACAWFKFADHDGPDRIEDDEVAMVRQAPDDEVTEPYFFSGEERIKRNIEMFGDALPEVKLLADGEVEFIIRHRRLFSEKQIIADDPSGVVGLGTSYVAGHGEYTLTEVICLPFTVDTPLFKSAVRYLKATLDNKVYTGFALVEDAKHGYVGSLNGQSFADKEVDWVIRQLIPIAQALPVKPPEKKLRLVDPFSTGHGISVHDQANKNGRVYSAPKKPKNNKALKKAAKKAKTLQRKAAKG